MLDISKCKAAAVGSKLATQKNEIETAAKLFWKKSSNEKCRSCKNYKNNILYNYIIVVLIIINR